MESLMLAKELKLENVSPTKIWNISQKIDGARYQLVIDKDKVSLIGRHSNSDSNDKYPEIIEEAKKIHSDSKIILDGELCVGTENGIWVMSNFLLLASREHTQHSSKINLLKKMYPAKFYIFDIISEGTNGMILRDRLEVMQNFVGQFNLKSIKPIPNSEGNFARAELLMADVRKIGLEGLMLKNPESKYSNGRSEDWLKWKNFVERDLKVIGYTSKTREISALLLEGGNKVNALISEVWRDKLLRLNVSLVEKNINEEKYEFTDNISLTARVKYMEGQEHIRFPILMDLRFNEGV